MTQNEKDRAIVNRALEMCNVAQRGLGRCDNNFLIQAVEIADRLLAEREILEKMNESQKMLLWHLRDDYMNQRGTNGFTTSLYVMFENLIEFDGRHYEKYGKFNEKERVQIIRAFTKWALEQEDDE
ncbi:hypothetical protein HB904_09400 [Listeria booriae]|uniref:Uncharacterized protein n=1 Tax=Listeria booriae TaxID=1552123 RepID=A0A842AHR9_9LIST|nr:hypothetical protein [Listeria booriae]MBC1616404.1 hypothetical protein [Listeria booriae]